MEQDQTNQPSIGETVHCWFCRKPGVIVDLGAIGADSNPELAGAPALPMGWGFYPDPRKPICGDCVLLTLAAMTENES